ncbi:MAG: hypothetical protein H5T99_03225 [Moorella sp. (in: Bacteria)]|nr:hypothetical protein [Moorella sp. (in: firmicutes)]
MALEISPDREPPRVREAGGGACYDKRKGLPGSGCLPVQGALRDICPPTWRRFQVTNDITLYKLHLVLKAVMGWWNYYLYQFIISCLAFSLIWLLLSLPFSPSLAQDQPQAVADAQGTVTAAAGDKEIIFTWRAAEGVVGYRVYIAG